MKRQRTSLLAGWALVGTLGGTAAPGLAATFDPEPVAPDLGVEVFDRGVAEEKLGRRLFGTPAASVVVGHVDLYDVFPYVESRYFVIVSDPEWNRLVVTATGSGRVMAFDGLGTEAGALRAPRGLAVDADGHVFLCDSGNDRVLVLASSTEFDHLTLVPVGEITGVSRPFGVAVSDAGTPFDTSDDRVYVAESGRNAVSRFARVDGGALAATGNAGGGDPGSSRANAGSADAHDAGWRGSLRWERTASLGGLGSGVGRFAGPQAVAVATASDGTGERIYVADAHNRRIVELRDEGGTLRWQQEVRHDAERVAGLETDRWGQVYVVAPAENRVTKFSPDLALLAVEEGARPQSFHVPVITTTDHRTGERSRGAEGRGLLVEEWSAGTGLRAVALGVAVEDLASAPDDPYRANFTLTDPARVEARLESATGEVLARRDLGLLTAGDRSVAFSPEEVAAEGGDSRWVVEARSTYADRTPVVATLATSLPSGGGGVLRSPVFAGSSPNPFVEGTALQLFLPGGQGGSVEAEIFDLTGRRVRRLTRTHTGGAVEVHWDGRDDRGHDLGSGVYFYRVRAAGEEWQGRTVRIR